MHVHQNVKEDVYFHHFIQWRKKFKITHYLYKTKIKILHANTAIILIVNKMRKIQPL